VVSVSHKYRFLNARACPEPCCGALYPHKLDLVLGSIRTPFQVGAAEYIRQQYPKPWDEHAEKLVVFMMGKRRGPGHCDCLMRLIERS
jgi:hypothetical protein